MAETNLGRIGFIPKGEYNASTTYQFLDLVYKDGISYASLKTQTGVTPTNDGVNWQQTYIPLYAEDLKYAVGSPAGTYANLAALISANPDHSKIYITLDDGKWNYWNGTAFAAGGVYQAHVIVDGSIKKSHLDFYAITGQRGVNLFNKDTITPNKYMNESGVINTLEDYFISDYIEVSPNTSYVGTWRLFNAIAYDKNKLFIGEITESPLKVFTTGATAKYIRITVAAMSESLETFILNEGEVLAAYTPYDIVIKNLSVRTESLADGSVTNDKLSGGITSDKLSFEMLGGEPSKNLFNKATVTENKYADFNTGNLGTLADMTVSDYIPVSAGTTYSVSVSQPDGYWVVAYNTNKEYISGITLSPTEGVFTSPALTAYLRLNVDKEKLDYQMLELGDTKTNYQPYGAMLNRDQVKDLDAPYGFKILLPSEIYLVSGEKFSVYFANIIKNYQNYKKGDYYITCLKKDGTVYSALGQTYSYKWEFTPPHTKTTLYLEFRIISTYDDSIMASKVVILRVANALASANHGRTTTIISIGDSFLDNDTESIIGKFYDNITTKGGVNNATMLGLHRASWSNSSIHDDSWAGYTYSWFYNTPTGYLRDERALSDAVWDVGWGENEANGWTTGQTYADLSEAQKLHGKTKNQFYNPATTKFDFPYYMNKYHSNASVDTFICALGLNDVGWIKVSEAKGVIISLVPKIQHIIDSVHTYNASIKILLYTIPKQMEDNNTIGKFFTNFAHYERVNHNIELFNDMLISEFDGDTNVIVMPSGANFDLTRGYKTADYTPDKFEPSYVETLSSDIHPNETGAKYIADTLYQTTYNVGLH